MDRGTWLSPLHLANPAWLWDFPEVPNRKGTESSHWVLYCKSPLHPIQTNWQFTQLVLHIPVIKLWQIVSALHDIQYYYASVSIQCSLVNRRLARPIILPHLQVCINSHVLIISKALASMSHSINWDTVVVLDFLWNPPRSSPDFSTNFPERDLPSVAAGMICFRVISRFASFPTFPSACRQQAIAIISISIRVI